MTVNQPDRVTAIYDSIDAFQRTHRMPGLQHAQIRGLLAEHLARVLPVAVPVSPSATRADDRAALREQIADAIHRDLLAHSARRDQGLLGIVPRLADAVLAVLPPPADRAAAVAQSVTRAIFSLKSAPPSGSQHYRSGWDDGLEAAMDAARDAVLGVWPAGSEDTTTTRAAVALRDAADFYDQLLTDMGTDVSCDPRYWTAVRDMVMGLRRRADEAQPTAPHSCSNCEGEDPDTCWTNPNRPPEPCPAAEFGDYGQQCGKPVGHELHTFEEQPAAFEADRDSQTSPKADSKAGPATPSTPPCALCRHPKRDHDGRADHRAKSSPLVAGDPWCHACNDGCDYAEQPAPAAVQTDEEASRG